MDSPIAESDDYVFLSSRNSVTSNSRSDAPSEDVEDFEPDESDLTLTKERSSSLLRASQSCLSKQLQAERKLKTSSLKRSRHPSDNGGVACQLLNPRKSTDDLPSGRGLRLLHRTLSLSIEGRGHRTQSMSESPSTASNSGILSAFDATVQSHSSTSSLIRMRRSAKGQSAPNIFLSSRDSASSAMHRHGNQSGNNRCSASFNSGMPSSRSGQSPKHQSPRTHSPKTLSPRTLSPKRMSSVIAQMVQTTGAACSSASADSGQAPATATAALGQHLPAHLRTEAKSHDSRRWSLPSSGYGTHTPDSADSSQCSSKENLNPHQHTAHQQPQLQPQRTLPEQQQRQLQQQQQYSSSDLNPVLDDRTPVAAAIGASRSSPLRLRSRSLSSPARSPGAEQDLVLMNSVYKERFPKAQAQMEERLQSYYSQLESLMPEERNAIARYSLRQIQELARDCLMKSQNNQLSGVYFFEITQKVEVLAQECEEKSKETLARVLDWGRQLLVIVSRAARLLECLEFNPAEFLQLLEAAEGQVRQADAVHTDIPRYIISKLGLNKDPLEDLVDLASDQQSLAESLSDSAAASDATDSSCIFHEPSEEDFHVVKLISNGAYGAVHLVRHRSSRQRFAMKKVKKTHLVLRNQVDQVFAERDILSFADNPFVVSLLCTFETKKYLCMVMEFVEGGDCASLLEQIKILPLDLARMYFAEMVLALEYLHNYGIVHRDLKPSNLLISSEGHIKLTDFGLSKIGLMNLTTNLYEAGMKDCAMFTDAQIFGTPEYISPEVILRQGYGKPVDWWAAGIILYQFLVGCVPFTADSAEELFMLLVSEQQPQIEWPDGDDSLPAEAVDLIERLLETSPLLRLGTEGPAEVKEHSFFSSLDWDGLLKEKSQFVPQLDHDEDTSYFDPRSDRYNHESNSDSEELDESDDPLFQSFKSLSPRFSQMSGTPPPSPQPQPPPSAAAPIPAAASPSSTSCSPASSSLMPAARHSITSSRTRADSSPPGLRRTASLRRPNVSPLAADAAVTRSPSAHQLPAGASSSSSGSSCMDVNKPPFVMRRGSRGFGFTIRAIRVFQGDTNFFLLHHLVVFVQRDSPAAAAGLRVGDLVTHVNERGITGLPHPEVIALILQDHQLVLRAIPLTATPIRSDGRPRGAQAGRMLRSHRRRRSRCVPTIGHTQQAGANPATAAQRQGPPTPLRYRMLKSVDSATAAAAAAAAANASASTSTAAAAAGGQSAVMGRPQSLSASQPLCIQAPQPRTRAASSSSSLQAPTSPRRKSTHSSVAPSPLAVSPSQGQTSPQIPAAASWRPAARTRVNTSTTDELSRKS